MANIIILFVATIVSCWCSPRQVRAHHVALHAPRYSLRFCLARVLLTLPLRFRKNSRCCQSGVLAVSEAKTCLLGVKVVAGGFTRVPLQPRPLALSPQTPPLQLVVRAGSLEPVAGSVVRLGGLRQLVVRIALRVSIRAASGAGSRSLA